MAETQINHLQSFQSMVEAVKIVMGTGEGGGASNKGVATQAGLSSVMAGLGSGG